MVQNLSISSSEIAGSGSQTGARTLFCEPTASLTRENPSRTLFRKLSRFLPLLVMVVLVNAVFDPSHLFSEGRYEQGMARLLLTGSNVANVVNYNDRLLQRFYINGLTRRNDVIVLGSSRSMEIDSKLFPGKRFFNHSVTQANLEDFFAIYEMYRKRNLRPGRVILELDPWLFQNNEPIYWPSIRTDFNDLAEQIGLPPKKNDLRIYAKSQFERYIQIVSPSYFQTSVFLFLNALKNKAKKDYFATARSVDPALFIKLSDGSLSYSQGMQQNSVSPDVIQASAEGYFHLNKSPENSLAKKEFETFIKWLRKDGVQVKFFLTPFHPGIIKTLKTTGNSKFIDQAEEYFRAFARSQRIPVLGSYNPSACSCDETEFYDPIHPKPSAIRKIFAAERPRQP